MKTMKRLVCALLAVLSAFAFCACGEGHPIPELVKYFEVTNLTLTYKKDGENRSSYMFYNVEKDEYNVV